MDEIVGLYDESGREWGSAPRSRVRAENLRHAATAVAVLSSAGDIYLHRRTDTKDLYPGLFDFCAGGVVRAGEDPYESAVREAEEELGVHGVELRSLGEADFADEHTSYHDYCFETTYDGPIRWQPEEVSWGEWVAPADLAARLDAAPATFMPDTLGVMGQWLRDRASAG